MSDPSAYEVLDPLDFGVERHIEIAHRLTGWNALRARAQSLKLDITDDQIKAVTKLVKSLADERQISVEQLDQVLLQVSRTAAPTGSSVFFSNADNAPSQELANASRAAGEALRAYEERVAQDAIVSIAKSLEDLRPTIAVKIEGHIFDHSVVNKILDLVVDSPCSFEVKQLNVGGKNEFRSSASKSIESAKRKRGVCA